MKWFLFFLGTLAYFFIRYDGRTDKSKEFDFLYWLKDNWAQLSGGFILDLMAFLLIAYSGFDISIWLGKYVPEGLVGLTVLAIPAACGLGLGYGAYELLKVFLKKKTDKVINE